MSKAVLGVDIGGVLFKDDTDTPANGERMGPPVTGALESLARLSRAKFGAEIYFISKCGANMQMNTIRRLREHRVFEMVGIPDHHLTFCVNRADKVDLTRQLHVTHHIDDRLEILALLKKVSKRILFCPNMAEVERHKEHLPSTVRADSWDDVVRLILG